MDPAAEPGASDSSSPAELPEKCQFCGAPLEDLGLAFIEHVNENEDCENQWHVFRGNVQREAGSS